MAWLNPVRIADDPWLVARSGQVPIVVTASHAGKRRIPGVARADRTTQRAAPDPDDCGYDGSADCGFSGSVYDIGTRTIVEATFAALDHKGLRPYVVVPAAARRDCDLNRSWNHNRCGYDRGCVSVEAKALARSIYDAHYGQIAMFLRDIRTRFSDMPGAPVFADVHGLGLDADQDVAIGTRNGAAAARRVVYGGPGWPRSLHQALSEQFAVIPSPGAQERFNGCWSIRAHGTGGGGANAIQLEFDGDRRDPEEEARDTGRKLADALDDFIRANHYPILNDDAPLSGDDEAYAALL